MKTINGAGERKKIFIYNNKIKIKKLENRFFFAGKLPYLARKPLWIVGKPFILGWKTVFLWPKNHLKHARKIHIKFFGRQKRC